MSTKKHLTFILAVIMVAVIALSAGTAFAGSFGKTAPSHPPVCVRTDRAGSQIWELTCTDIGKDIVNAAVKTNTRYDLEWNAESVILRVYPEPKGSIATWFVVDAKGSAVTGVMQ